MRIFATIWILLLALLYSCSLPDGDGSGGQSFDYNLRGIWKKTNNEWWEDPIPEILIDYKNITIIGVIEHFGNLPREVPLEGYSDNKESLIYINARGEWQTPIAYRLWETGSTYPKIKMLTLKFSGLEDIDFVWVKFPDQ